MSVSQLWETLLDLSEQIRNYQEQLSYCVVQPKGNPSILFNTIPDSFCEQNDFCLYFGEGRPVELFPNTFSLRQAYELVIQQLSADFSTEKIDFLKIYLPYCCLNHWAEKAKRAISVAHFAQSLDGKIATHQGHSRWIGNEENLIHAHRMRALCDAIIIGNNTLSADRPRLTVRRVAGRNPQRIVLGKPQADYSSLLESSQEPILVINSHKQGKENQLDFHVIPSANGHIHGVDVLRYLYQLGIHSVYIEGGAITTSNFLRDSAIDLLQLHISPCIFGSGKAGIILPAIDEVEQCIQFQDFHFQKVGDTLMFIGRPNVLKGE